MKKQIVVLSLLIVCGLPAIARVSQPDNSIDGFWIKFKAAVINGDKPQVIALTQFPVTMSYGVRSIKTKSELITRYKQVFNGEANAAKCFATARPEKDPQRPREFTVGCDNGSGQEVIIYRFVLTKLGWKFKSLDNINE
jgi:hypothetical protein